MKEDYGEESEEMKRFNEKYGCWLTLILTILITATWITTFFMSKELHPEENKFHKGNGEDGKHYWLTPPDVYEKLNAEHNFDFDPCPFPKPEDFDGLTCEWGESSYVNPPFGSIMHNGKKKGATAWVRKAIEEHKKGKKVVFVHPIDKWVLMLIAAGAKITNLGDVKWLATEDGTPGKGTGRHIACFVLEPEKQKSPEDILKEIFEICLKPSTPTP